VDSRLNQEITPMAKKTTMANRQMQAWIDARIRHRLTHGQVQMARELGMNPAKLGKLDNHRQERWKLPLSQFIEELYSKRFGKAAPDTVISIEERARREREKKERRRALRQQRFAARKRSSDERWVEGKDLRLVDEVRYIQRRAAENIGRIVTIGPLSLFSTESGDAWILDPADHLATRIAEGGDPRPIHVEETEMSFAVGWQGRYDIVGPAFVFTDRESGSVATTLGYPTQQIADRIAAVWVSGCS
jgi:hypothetical protein